MWSYSTYHFSVFFSFPGFAGYKCCLVDITAANMFFLLGKGTGLFHLPARTAYSKQLFIYRTNGKVLKGDQACRMKWQGFLSNHRWK